jgi:hypothetical protein
MASFAPIKELIRGRKTGTEDICLGEEIVGVFGPGIATYPARVTAVHHEVPAGEIV